jgi:5-methylcytosine-specific restriction endonuclease McrA
MQESIKLIPASYDLLRRQVLQRDGWRCQYCGGTRELEVHHIRYRSQLGSDVEANLITLCASCHGFVHLKGLRT